MCTDPRGPAAVLAAVVVALAGCGGSTPEHGDPATSQPAAAPQAQPPAQPSTQPPSQPPSPKGALDASFTELADTIAADIGLAVAPVGASTVSTFGSWSTGVAWSTIKVPLAIAALRDDDAAAQAPATAAITLSDNAAAEQLWSQLGTPEQAARRVQSVLAEGGDPATLVESRRLRPGFTAFGQTQWPLDRQAVFAAHLPCLADSAQVLELMGNLAGGQRWGLAADGSPAKGGWGPGVAGGYLVRQFGLVSTDTGQLAVAIAADADSFDAGIAALNQLASWVAGHTAELPGGRCPA